MATINVGDINAYNFREFRDLNPLLVPSQFGAGLFSLGPISYVIDAKVSTVPPDVFLGAGFGSFTDTSVSGVINASANPFVFVPGMEFLVSGSNLLSPSSKSITSLGIKNTDNSEYSYEGNLTLTNSLSGFITTMKSYHETANGFYEIIAEGNLSINGSTHETTLTRIGYLINDKIINVEGSIHIDTNDQVIGGTIQHVTIGQAASAQATHGNSLPVFDKITIDITNASIDAVSFFTLGWASIAGKSEGYTNLTLNKLMTDIMANLSSSDTILGSSSADMIDGKEGNDTLDGGSGKDTLIGGNGNDTYIVDISSNGKYEDKLVEAKNAGTDTLAYRSAFGILSKAVTLKLVKNFENLDISQTGNTNFNLTGDAGNNVLTGNDGDNVIDGGKGVDTLIGNAGNDTYVVDNAGDIVTEAVGEGTDTVQVKIGGTGSYTLTDNVENGSLLNKEVFDLTGNALVNTLVGNAKANTLIGLDGNDTLNGGKGNDTLNAGAGNDAMTGGAGADTFLWTLADAGTVGAAAVDTIQDFSVKQKDVLDLRDLLPSNAVEGDVAGLLANFIDVRIDGTNTVIGINTDGNLGSGENQQITFSNVNLFTLTNTADETALLNNMISKNQLLID